MKLRNIIISIGLVSVNMAGFAAPIVSQSSIQEHNEAAGGAGTDEIPLKIPKALGAQCVAISSVKIEYIKRRYGKVVADPKSIKACKVGSCKLLLSWSHAPAGRLSYRVKVNWKEAGCG